MAIAEFGDADRPLSHRRARRPAAVTRPPTANALRRTLRRTFRIDQLTEGQQAVIDRVLAGKDTLAIMPTGAGKSLCYQLPALHLDGTTVVVSPLISLMKDQAEKLEKAGVRAEQLNSAQPVDAQDASMRRIAEATNGIVFTTPERLADPVLIAGLREQKIALFVIDEAHCIAQWGHDFRPAFLEIDDALRRLDRPPVLALTATATADVVEDIRQQLGRPRMKVVNTGIYRPNLRFAVTQVTNDGEKAARLVEAVRGYRGAGIVYTATVKACVEVYETLVAAGEPATLYHGRLRAAERHANQDRFMRGDCRVMVATSAFGMGIDKADVRFVLHHQLPGTLEAYYQEAGRAGRDGEPADCALLYYRRDRQVQQFFLARRYPTADDLQRVHEALRFSEPVALAALHAQLDGVPRSRAAVALALLRDAGLARVDRSRRWSLKPGRDAGVLAELAGAYDDKAERDREALERVIFYAQTGYCRWRVLLEHFGEALPFAARCGQCDNCLRPPPAIETAEPIVATPPAPPRLKPGDGVRVPRYGGGHVIEVAGDEVKVGFADGAERRFVADYVQLQ